MITINRENNQEELDELAKPCPNQLCFSYAQIPNRNHDLTDWYWLYKIDDNIYDCLDLRKIPFIQHKQILSVLRKSHSTEMFQINLSQVPKDVSQIEIGLNNMGKIRYTMSEIKEFNIKMFNIENEENIKLWNEWNFKNILFSGRFLKGKQLLIGTFARVNDFWRFYPQMLDVESIWNYPIFIV